MHLIRVSSVLAISVLQGERTAVDHAIVQAELLVRYLGCQTKSDILLESVLLCINHYVEEADAPDNTRDTDHGYASTLQRAWQSIVLQPGHRASSRNLTLPPLKSTGLLDGYPIPMRNQTPAQ